MSEREGERKNERETLEITKLVNDGAKLTLGQIILSTIQLSSLVNARMD